MYYMVYHSNRIRLFTSAFTQQQWFHIKEMNLSKTYASYSESESESESDDDEDDDTWTNRLFHKRMMKRRQRHFTSQNKRIGVSFDR